MSREKELITGILEELKGNVDLFYQQKTVEALGEFDGILGKVMDLVDTLFIYRQEHEEFPLEEDKVKDALTEAMAALEDKDMILLADIIQYDFIEYIEELVSGIE